MAPTEEDGIIFHLAPRDLWDASGDEYTPPTYEQDGFVHATKNPALLLGIANHFYKDKKGEYILLHIEESKLIHKVVYEAPMPVGATQPPEGDHVVKFPHIYGPINKSSVVEETLVERDIDGTFVKFGECLGFA